MKCRLNISDCLLQINESVNLDLIGLEEEYRNQALKELQCVIKKMRCRHPEQCGEPVVHVSARRLHFYGKIGVFYPGFIQGRYRICLSKACWIISDYNATQNEIFVTIELGE